jgi:hypothetical protein
MSTEAVFDQIAGILAKSEIEFSVTEDNSTYWVPVPEGSTQVRIRCGDFAEDKTVIAMDAPLLQNVKLKRGSKNKILERLNDLNISSYFAKFCVGEDEDELGTIWIEYEILGDNLQPAELINALSVVGFTGDRVDDELRGEFGGDRISDLAEAAERAETKDGIAV